MHPHEMDKEMLLSRDMQWMRDTAAESARATSKPAGPVGSLSCDALVGPLAKRHWEAPFRYDAGGAMIWDAQGERALDVRGWGMLTGKGALGLSPTLAEEITADFGESVVRILNAAWPNNADHAQPGGSA